eukprot:7771532-Pyramimonas_sp.AAC.1
MQVQHTANWPACRRREKERKGRPQGEYTCIRKDRCRRGGRQGENDLAVRLARGAIRSQDFWGVSGGP